MKMTSADWLRIIKENRDEIEERIEEAKREACRENMHGWRYSNSNQFWVDGAYFSRGEMGGGLMFFINNEHQQNFTIAQQQVKYCKTDNAYLVTVYILSLPELYNKGVGRYLSGGKFDWWNLLNKTDLSSGYKHLVKLAANLFTGGLGGFNLAKANCCLDDDLFNVMIQAILLYRGN